MAPCSFLSRFTSNRHLPRLALFLQLGIWVLNFTTNAVSECDQFCHLKKGWHFDTDLLSWRKCLVLLFFLPFPLLFALFFHPDLIRLKASRSPTSINQDDSVIPTDDDEVVSSWVLQTIRVKTSYSLGKNCRGKYHFHALCPPFITNVRETSAELYSSA